MCHYSSFRRPKLHLFSPSYFLTFHQTMAISKRSLPPSPGSSQKRARTVSSNPLGIKPLGNLLVHPSNTRSEGLGTLAILPDELLLSFVVSLLDGEDLVRLAGVSKAWYGWSSIEGIWKGIYISVRFHALLEQS